MPVFSGIDNFSIKSPCGLPPADNVMAEVIVFDRDWVLSDMVVDHEMFDMAVTETWRMDGNEQTRIKTNV